jgi:hypothetical protein
MSQPYNSIGQSSPPLDAVAAQHSGHPDDIPQPLGAQLTDPTNSFFADRANTQQLGLHIPNIAAHTETPMAARHVHPYLRDD